VRHQRHDEEHAGRAMHCQDTSVQAEMRGVPSAVAHKHTRQVTRAQVRSNRPSLQRRARPELTGVEDWLGGGTSRSGWPEAASLWQASGIGKQWCLTCGAG
jgi:hypothetical protein